MMRQYGPGRFRYELIGRAKVMPVGTVPVGTIVRFEAPYRRTPRTVIVEAWFPRCVSSGRGDRFTARGGHLAQVRDLRTGMRTLLSDAWLQGSND